MGFNQGGDINKGRYKRGMTVHSESRFSGPRFSGSRGLTDKFSKPNFSIIILSRFNGFNGFSYIFDLADIF